MSNANLAQHSNPGAPLLVNVGQAATMLSIGRTALYELIWSGELAPIRIGRSVRFAVEDLEAFVERRRH